MFNKHMQHLIGDADYVLDSIIHITCVMNNQGYRFKRKNREKYISSTSLNLW